MPTFPVTVGRYHAGRLNALAPEAKVAIVASRFNSLIVEQLVKGAVSTLEYAGCASEAITLVEVPGAFEILFAAQKLIARQSYCGLICLGAVIRGETPHFEMVANNVCSGIAQLNLSAKIPVIMGLLTTDTAEQALDRAGVKSGNNGSSAAQCLLEMLSLARQLER